MTFGSNGGFGTTGGGSSPDPVRPQLTATPSGAAPVVDASEGTGLLTTIGWILAALAVVLALGVGGAVAINVIGGTEAGGGEPDPGVVEAPRESGSEGEVHSPGREPVPEPQPGGVSRPGEAVEDV